MTNATGRLAGAGHFACLAKGGNCGDVKHEEHLTPSTDTTRPLLAQQNHAGDSCHIMSDFVKI